MMNFLAEWVSILIRGGGGLQYCQNFSPTLNKIYVIFILCYNTIEGISSSNGKPFVSKMSILGQLSAEKSLSRSSFFIEICEIHAPVPLFISLTAERYDIFNILHDSTHAVCGFTKHDRYETRRSNAFLNIANSGGPT